jgi:ribosomal subunit interface protein
MHLNIAGHHMHNGKSLERYVNVRMKQQVKKYFKNAVSADVVFLKDHYEFQTSIVINDGTKHHQHIQSKASSTNVYKSFNMAMEKTMKQLRRCKNKLKQHKGNRSIRAS